MGLTVIQPAAETGKTEAAVYGSFAARPQELHTYGSFVPNGSVTQNRR
jgi:hypothetical protein